MVDFIKVEDKEVTIRNRNGINMMLKGCGIKNKLKINNMPDIMDVKLKITYFSDIATYNHDTDIFLKLICVGDIYYQLPNLKSNSYT